MVGVKRVFYDFIRSGSFGGILLMISAVIAMVIANSSFQNIYYHTLHTNFGFSFGDYFVGFSLQHWINDVLMALFFLMVGLEIKRELIFGELNTFSKAAFPAIAAVGGMVIPGLIYYYLNFGTSSEHGFGIPMATDIAFVLGVIMILGKKVPTSLKVFLVTLAVVDDLGAIVVIAVFYSSSLDLIWLLISALIIFALFICNRLSIKSLSIYLFLGILLWFSVHFSNIHATIAAVVLAFFVPIKPKKNLGSIKDSITSMFTSDKIIQNSNMLDNNQMKIVDTLKKYTVDVQNPLLRLEHALQPWNAYFIMPIFALANAGVSIKSEFNINIDYIFLGVILGLVVGKPIGILLFTFVSEKMKIANRPYGISWMHILGGGMLSGIGFTMSIFVSNLAFTHESSIDLAKIAVLIASLTSCLIGSLCLIIYSLFKK